MRALRVVSLFFVYGGLGWMGDQAASLLAAGPASDGSVTRVDVHVAASGACAFETDRALSLELPEGGSLAIDAGAGTLRVEGREGWSGVTAVGHLCASSRDLLESLELAAETSGREVRVVSAHDRDRRRSHRDGTARIDLLVTMPAGTSLDIHDSSGDIVVESSGDLRVADSSGPIEVHEVLGSVRIADGSGDILIDGAAGDVEIADGSGGIEVVGVRGSVVVSDGSGSIDIARVGADVLIEADGSGSIDVRDVAGDFAVARDGSGGVRYSGVTGRVDVPAPGRSRDRRR